MFGKCETLWVIAYGRDFKLVRQWIDKVDFVDKLEINFHMHHDALKIAKDYFMKHKQYKYLIVSTDDVLGTACNVKQILEDEKEHDFDVVSGWTNVKLDKPWAAVSLTPHDGIETKISTYDSYHFINMADILTGRLGYPFFKAWFVGLPLTLMKRELLETEKISFTNGFLNQKDRLCLTPETKENGRPIMFDLQFAIECEKQGIPIMIDTRVFMLHFGFGVISSLKPGVKVEGDHMMVGKRDPEIQFTKARN